MVDGPGDTIMEWSGQINLKLSTEDEHEIVFNRLDGDTVNIAAQQLVIRILNNFGKNFVRRAGITDA